MRWKISGLVIVSIVIGGVPLIVIVPGPPTIQAISEDCDEPFETDCRDGKRAPRKVDPKKGRSPGEGGEDPAPYIPCYESHTCGDDFDKDGFEDPVERKWYD